MLRTSSSQDEITAAGTFWIVRMEVRKSPANASKEIVAMHPSWPLSSVNKYRRNFLLNGKCVQKAYKGGEHRRQVCSRA